MFLDFLIVIFIAVSLWEFLMLIIAILKTKIDEQTILLTNNDIMKEEIIKLLRDAVSCSCVFTDPSHFNKIQVNFDQFILENRERIDKIIRTYEAEIILKYKSSL